MPVLDGMPAGPPRLAGAVLARGLVLLLVTAPPLTQWASAQAEAHDHRMSVYLELLGNAGFYSLNADFRLTPWAGGRVGFSHFRWAFLGGSEGTSVPLLVVGRSEGTLFPLLVYGLLGAGSWKLEAGAGVLLGAVSVEQTTFLVVKGVERAREAWPTAALGFRYQRAGGGFLFRLMFTPILVLGDFDPFGSIPGDHNRGLLLLPGLSLGYTF